VRQFEVARADGQLVPVEVVSTLLVDQAGAAHSVAGVLRSLAAQREQEAARRRFASMLNHEFRTPLSTIDGAIQRLEVTGANADEATRKRYRNIALAVDRLIAMLDDYLTPAQLEGTGQVRRSDALDPRQLLREGAELARASGRAATLDLGELPDLLRCDPQGLRLAMKVLIGNAVLYTPPGTAIALAGRRAGGGIELVVRDHGAGVPEGELEKIFTKSYRGSNAGARPGSGLGLYMARAVVEVHGGSLGASNAAPHGAQFRIWLPAQGGKGKEVASGSPSSDNPGNKTG
jgi:signal transduction histidine kinase